MISKLSILCCTLLMMSQTFKAQYMISDTVTIKSKIFDSERKVILTKPKHNDKILAPQLFIYFDADDPEINGMVLQSANVLTGNQEIPKSVLIGIMQVDRNTEFLSKDTLLKFLIDELLPYLRNKQIDTSRITLIGHSFGGYFATYAFLKKNSTFSSCIAISPAYWPNKQDIFVSPDFLKNVSGNFYMALGDRRWDEISLGKYAIKMRDLMKTSEHIRFRFDDLKGFGHNATIAVGFGLGLNYIFDEWEWQNILKEQERRLKSDPDFWGFLEIQAEALCHLHRGSEADKVFKQAIQAVKNDRTLEKSESQLIIKRIKKKRKTACSTNI